MYTSKFTTIDIQSAGIVGSHSIIETELIVAMELAVMDSCSAFTGKIEGTNREFALLVSIVINIKGAFTNVGS